MKQSISIYHSTFLSPIGNIYIGMTDKGLCCIAWNRSSWNRFLKHVQEQFTIKVKYDERKFSGIKHDFEQYFIGNLNHFIISVDLFAMTRFQKKALKAAQDIVFGTVKSYHDLAVAIGSPNASRAVGNALGKNPIPIVIPCHRVVKSDGSIGGFTGGLNIKRFLLHLEKVEGRFL